MTKFWSLVFSAHESHAEVSQDGILSSNGLFLSIISPFEKNMVGPWANELQTLVYVSKRWYVRRFREPLLAEDPWLDLCRRGVTHARESSTKNRGKYRNVGSFRSGNSRRIWMRTRWVCVTGRTQHRHHRLQRASTSFSIVLLITQLNSRHFTVRL